MSWGSGGGKGGAIVTECRMQKAECRMWVEEKKGERKREGDTQENG